MVHEAHVLAHQAFMQHPGFFLLAPGQQAVHVVERGCGFAPLLIVASLLQLPLEFFSGLRGLFHALYLNRSGRGCAAAGFLAPGYLLCLRPWVGYYYQSDMSAGETESLAISAEGATAPETLRQKDR